MGGGDRRKHRIDSFAGDATGGGQNLSEASLRLNSGLDRGYGENPPLRIYYAHIIKMTPQSAPELRQCQFISEDFSALP